MQYYEENISEKVPSEEDSLVSDYAALRKQIGALPEQLPGTEDAQLSQVMAYLTEPDSDALFSMVLDESQPEALRRLPLTKCYLPRQIIVKAVAETYHKDFRELWEQAKTGYAHWFYQESTTQGQTPIEPIPTDVYLRITPEDRLFSLPPEALDTLTSETQVWLKGLRSRFKEILRGPNPYADGLSFQRSMLETLSEMQGRNAGIWVFRDMFYEFLANWQQPAYQSLWALFVEMAGAEDADPARRVGALVQHDRAPHVPVGDFHAVGFHVRQAVEARFEHDARHAGSPAAVAASPVRGDSSHLFRKV